MHIEDIDHLGLVAGTVDELGLVEAIDQMIEPHELEHISAGQVVKAMILNALGFVSAPLYLFSEFFESKAIGHLLGEGVEAAHLNDDRLGRVLDKLYKLGTTEVFLAVALLAVERFGVDIRQVHADSTSFAVDGEYGNEERVEPTPIQICRGYSRDNRPDLKQFLVSLVCSADGGVPLWLKVGNGNDSDAQQFAMLMRSFSDNWQCDSLIVIDAAFYSQPNLQQVKTLRWLSRVPQTLSAAQALVQADTSTLREVPCDLPGYQMWEVEQDYGGIPQRWILIESHSRRADAELWKPELEKLERRLKRQLKDLCKQVFACKPDALDALIRFKDSLEVHNLTAVSVEVIEPKRPPGRPSKAAKAQTPVGYQLSAQLKRIETTEQQFSQKRSRFILATNQMDRQQWPAKKLLTEYKGQQKVERGFRFLKDPLFFTSSVFLKKPSRVQALALIMALTLLVYTLAERKLRQALTHQQQTVLDQRKRPTAKPTFRWIMQKFQGIHWVSLGSSTQISNLSDERQLIIRLLGPPAQRYYTGST